MTKKTSALEARKNLGRLLEEAYYRGDEFVIERAGKPMAVLVPVQEYNRWRKQREDDFAIFDEVREKIGGAGSGKVERDVAEAVAEVRKKGA
ncbi:MAG: type II toxin-antitoxin system Phd/YefM family antitoxin [Actinomycetota bacterium]